MNNFTLVSFGLKNLRLGFGASTQVRSYGADSVAIPPKPKKPLGPYLKFAMQIRPQIMKENPSLKATEIMKMCGSRWGGLETAKKEDLKKDFRKEMDSYSAILEKYNNSLTDVQRDEIRREKLEKTVKKEAKERKRREKELGKPKKPLNPFLLYLKSAITDKMTIEQHQALAKEKGEKWRSLTEAEKLPYLKEYDENVKAYGKTLAKWEERMIKQGNEDLVRQSAKLQMNKKAAKAS